MLLYEYKLRLSRAQAAAIDEAIRASQYIRNKALRLWRDGRGVSANDLPFLCARLAQEYSFAARLNSQARQAAAARAWAAIEPFYTNCREQRPGKKGYPRFQRDCRSVEYKQTGWQLDGEGKRLTLTDGGGVGQVQLLRRADGYYAQFALQVERRIEHVPTGSAVGIDGGTTRIPRTQQRPPSPPLCPNPLRRPSLPPSASRPTGGRRSSGWGGRICISSGSARTAPANRRARSAALAT